MKRRKVWPGILAIGVIAVLACAWGAFGGKTSSAISIIGGGDGPTSVFIAGKVGSGAPYYIVVLVLALAAAGILLWRSGRK